MGEWKLVLHFRGSTVIETVVDTALRACERVIVVSGYRGSDLESILRGRSGVEVVRNPEWQRGMFSSIQLGIGHVSAERFFITLGDKPRIESAVYQTLRDSDPADIVFPVFDGTRGHPVLLRACVREAVLAADPRTGSMREIVSRFQVGEVAWRDDTILRDIDTREDYVRERDS
jgi:molybdenum cofactor cytidylyltransferase